MNTKTWLAAYFYHTEDSWSNFLTNHVKVFVEDIQKKKWADQFFFIRYWERGPHIRLRFKGDKKTLENKLKPYLDNYFKKYFKKNPSKRENPEWLKKLPKDQKWFPNNTIQYIEYEPETERYGGSKGILIAEKQFEASSKAVLSVMKESADWNYDRALGTAIQMHLGFAFALQMSVEELKHFCSLVYNGWFPRAYSYDPNRTAEETKKIQKVILKAFEENFGKQKPGLINYHQTIWNALKENTEFEQEWFNQWIKDMKRINTELRSSQKQKKLVFPKWFRSNNKIKISKSNQSLWSILESYVHMTNNRLGILNRDEAYLGFIIMNCIKEIT